MKSYRNAFLLALIGNLALVGVLAGIWWKARRSAPTQNPAAAPNPAAQAAQNNPATLPPASMETPLAPVQRSAEELQSIGVKFGEVARKPVNDEITTTGTVAIDETRLSYVQTRFSGYIKKVFADATYKYVRKGQPLFTIYSPELAAAEREFLLAQQNAKDLSPSTIPGVAAGVASLLESSKQRLEQWNLSSREITRLESTGQVADALEMDSPVSGFITERNVLPNLTVQPETRLYTIADLSTVWVLAQVFQNDLGRIRVGEPATIAVDSYPGRKFRGSVDFIYPDVDMTTRTARVRLILSNPNLALSPGMFVNVTLQIPLGNQLVIPANGVLQSGTRLRQLPHRFRKPAPSRHRFICPSAARRRSGGSHKWPRRTVHGGNRFLDGAIHAAQGNESLPRQAHRLRWLSDLRCANHRAQLHAGDAPDGNGGHERRGASHGKSRRHIRRPDRPGDRRHLADRNYRDKERSRSYHEATQPERGRGNVAMISRVIDWCAGNRFLVFTATLLLILAGVWSLRNIPLDALPDISDVQVIVHIPWEGEPPGIIEDQVTYPIVTTMLAAPHVKAVRAQTMFGDSYIFVVFEDGTDLYWARSRVLEYIQQLQGTLPKNVSPMIGPDATGAGWVYEYAVIDRSHSHSLADLRSLQDWYLRYQLETVPGVSEVASIGGFVRQYQVNLDPNKLRAYNIPLSTVIDRVRESTNEVGGRVLEMGGAEYMIRGLGYIRSPQDLETVPVAVKNGTPVRVRDLGVVAFGPDIRRGVAEWNGEGETVGGIIVMRYGMNALTVINGVKRKLAEIKPSLPSGVEIVSGYDRSGLIQASIETLQRDLLEEIIIVSFVTIAFLFHFRSALIPILTLPIAVVAAFIPMYFLHVSSNIMSLGGLALAIGVLIDAAIVMVENGYRHLSEHVAVSPSGAARSAPSENERRRILIGAAKQVGPAIFFSLLIILVSFLPVFLLEAQEGRMFRPLAWTKTLSVAFSSILAITLVPVLMVIFIRGRLRPESANPFSRWTQALYLPVLRLCLRYRKTTLLLNLVFLAVTLPLAWRIGSQFMPPLYEGSSLYMPTALPGISITQASALLQEQDRIIKSFPEVETVFGAVGRSGSPTDNAPLDMYDTTIIHGPEASISRPHQYLDHARAEPPRHGTHRHQDSRRLQDPGPQRRRHSARRRSGAAASGRASRTPLHLCRTRRRRLLHQRRSQPPRSLPLRTHRRGRPARRHLRHRRRKHRRKRRRPRTLSHQRPLQPRFSR